MAETISVIIPVYNERKYLSLARQRRQKGQPGRMAVKHEKEEREDASDERGCLEAVSGVQ